MAVGVLPIASVWQPHVAFDPISLASELLINYRNMGKSQAAAVLPVWHPEVYTWVPRSSRQGTILGGLGLHKVSDSDPIAQLL